MVFLLMLIALVEACRSSVKFDLLHYEQLARNADNQANRVRAVEEASRLFVLLGEIDTVIGDSDEI